MFNRLIRRKYDADGPGGGAATNLFLVGYEGINPTLGFDGTAQADVSNRFLWGPQVDQLFADEQVTNPTSAGNTLWPLGDQVGTLRDIADYNGTAYTITNHRTYDSFGNMTAESQSSVDEIFAYTGKFFDEVTKLSNHLNRWFDPGLGKWVSEDPIGYAAGDPNLVRYVGNENHSRFDSNGLEAIAGGSISTTGGFLNDPSNILGGLLPNLGGMLQMGGLGGTQETQDPVKSNWTFENVVNNMPGGPPEVEKEIKVFRFKSALIREVSEKEDSKTIPLEKLVGDTLPGREVIMIRDGIPEKRAQQVLIHELIHTTYERPVGATNTDEEIVVRILTEHELIKRGMDPYEPGYRNPDNTVNEDAIRESVLKLPTGRKPGGTYLPTEFVPNPHLGKEPEGVLKPKK